MSARRWLQDEDTQVTVVLKLEIARLIRVRGKKF